MAVIRNREKCVGSLNITGVNNFGEEVHTNPDIVVKGRNGKSKVVGKGKEVVVTKITDDVYFNKRAKDKHKLSRGNSWLFDNHLEYSGWLWMNNFQSVNTEEVEGKHC